MSLLLPPSSGGFELDFSRFGALGLGENKVQNAVLQRSLDTIPIDVFRKRKHPLVITVGIFVINPLIARVVSGCAASADGQHPTLEGDVHPIGSDTRHFG